MSKSTWTGAVNSDWDDADNWSPAGVPGTSSDVVIANGTPLALASASIGTVNSITDSSFLSFRSAGTNTVATFLDDAGHLYVDAKAGEGGTILNIGGTLTDSGYLSIGNAALSAPDEVTAAALDNTGSVYLTGSSANQALLDVTPSAGFLGNDGLTGPGGGTLSIDGALNNTGTLGIFAQFGSTSSSSVRVKSFVNSGTVDLDGRGKYLAKWPSVSHASGPMCQRSIRLHTTARRERRGTILSRPTRCDYYADA